MASPCFAAFNVSGAFLPAMLARNSGQIVNIISPASFVAWPGATGDTAARWATRGFTKALRADLHHTRLTVTLLTAGLADTTYLENNPGGAHRVPGITRLFPTLTTGQVAAAIVRAVEREKDALTVPPLLILLLWARRPFPGLFDWLVIRTGWRPDRESDAGA